VSNTGATRFSPFFCLSWRYALSYLILFFGLLHAVGPKNYILKQEKHHVLLDFIRSGHCG
jgi:hypothetical protein